MIQETSRNLTARVQIGSEEIAGPVSPRVFGNFLEHLGFSIDGGVLAQALANPTFERDPRLQERQVSVLLTAGQYLLRFYESGDNPQVFPDNWSPGLGATGFGVAALDDYRTQQIPFPWAPTAQASLVKPSVGRLGGAVRLVGKTWSGSIRQGDKHPAEDGPAGIRQGIFLPFQRCLEYHGHIWTRIAALDSSCSGQLVVGLSRRSPEAHRAEILAVDFVNLFGNAWQKIPFSLEPTSAQVHPGEPVDYFILWLPQHGSDLLLDQALLFPADAVEGFFDPDVLQLVKEWSVPLLRWPGGNFVSHYHWRDGVGSQDRRPTRPNYAWGGLDYNFFGVSEFIHFCRLANTEPHIVVNSGTGTAEEAAAWVEYCNGAANTPMGALRAKYDSAEPYRVKLWEVGNETYGSWQGGFHGAEENALRCQEFSAAMRRVDPSLELIATGNQFDIAVPGPGLDHTQADRRWNQAVIQANLGQIDYLSLHCLPANDLFLEDMSDEQAYYSLMAQPLSWERVFLPDILRIAAQASRADTAPGGNPLRIAITEWGVLGSRGTNRPIVENYGEVPYAGVFLNMMLRNSNIAPISNATALLHGGCIRKAGGKVFVDPQYLVIQQYTRFAGSAVLACTVESPTYQVDKAPDLGLPLYGVPFVDAACCHQAETGLIMTCLVNRHLDQPITMRLTPRPGDRVKTIKWEYLAYADITARASLGDPDRFRIQAGIPAWDAAEIELQLPPCSVSWVGYTVQQ